MRNALYQLLTISFLLLLGSCGIKWATNKVLSNPDAIAKVGATYDALTPRDTTEKLVFIPGDSIVVEKTDTIRAVKDSLMVKADTIRIRTVRNIRTTDTIIRQMPPDNRHLARLNDSLALYRSLAANFQGNLVSSSAQLKTAEKRLIWMAAAILVLGVVIGVLIKFKIKL